MRKEKRKRTRYQRRRSSIFAKFLTSLLVVLLTLGVGVSGVYAYINGIATTSPAGQLPSEIATASELRGDLINILVCGIDYEEGRGNDANYGLTDVIMYVTFDRKGGNMSIMQIPRDTYVGPDYDTGTGPGIYKVNALYPNAVDTNNRMAALAQWVYDSMGLPVDNFVTIDMESFKDIVNAIDGVEMTVPRDIYSLDANGVALPDPTFVAGETYHLNGDGAELIMRSREYAVADIDRLSVQRYFYAAVFEKMMSFPLTDLIKLMPYYMTFVNTDLDLATLGLLAADFLKLEPSNIVIAKLPGEGFTEYFPEAEASLSYFSAHLQPTDQILNDYFRFYSEPVPAEALGLIEYQKTTEWLDGSVQRMDGIIEGEEITK